MTCAASGESAARSAADELAIPDDDDPPGSGLLDGEFSTASLLAGGCCSTDDDESAADLTMGHGGPFSGEGRRGVGSIQIATPSSRSRFCVQYGGNGHRQKRFPKDQITEEQRWQFMGAKPVQSPAWNGRANFRCLPGHHSFTYGKPLPSLAKPMRLYRMPHVVETKQRRL